MKSIIYGSAILFSASVLAEPVTGVITEGSGDLAVEQAQPQAPTQQEAMPTTETTAPEATGQTTESTGQAMAKGEVSRANFTSAVQGHEPIDQVMSLAGKHDKVFFFTELKGLRGQVVTHRWEYRGKVMANVPFEVRGNRWRVWSSKTLLPEWQGEWRVSVLNGAGDVLTSNTLLITEETGEAQSTPEAAEAPEAPTGLNVQ